MLTVLVLLAAGAVHSPLDFEVSLGSSIEDDDADLDDLLTLEDDASLEDAFAAALTPRRPRDRRRSTPSTASRSRGAPWARLLQRDFAAAWEWIRADAAKQLQKAAPTAEIEFLFLGARARARSSSPPHAAPRAAQLRRVAQVARVFYDRDYGELCAEVRLRIRELLGGQSLARRARRRAEFEDGAHDDLLEDTHISRSSNLLPRITLVVGFNALNMALPTDRVVWDVRSASCTTTASRRSPSRGASCSTSGAT